MSSTLQTKYSYNPTRLEWEMPGVHDPMSYLSRPILSELIPSFIDNTVGCSSLFRFTGSVLISRAHSMSFNEPLVVLLLEPDRQFLDCSCEIPNLLISYMILATLFVGLLSSTLFTLLIEILRSEKSEQGCVVETATTDSRRGAPAFSARDDVYFVTEPWR